MALLCPDRRQETFASLRRATTLMEKNKPARFLPGRRRRRARQSSPRSRAREEGFRRGVAGAIKALSRRTPPRPRRARELRRAKGLTVMFPPLPKRLTHVEEARPWLVKACRAIRRRFRQARSWP